LYGLLALAERQLITLVFTSRDNLIHCAVTPTVRVLHLVISTSFNLSTSLHFMERLILSRFLQLVRHLAGLHVLLLGGGSAADKAYPVTLRWCKISRNRLLTGAPGAALGPGKVGALLPHRAPKWRLWPRHGMCGAAPEAALSPSPHRSTPPSLLHSGFSLLCGRA